MSAIGEYVHYRAGNYIAYGIARRGNAPQFLNGNVQNYIKNKIKINSNINQNHINLLTNEVKKNSYEAVKKDESLANLHYGRKVNQYKKSIENEVLGKRIFKIDNETLTIQQLEQREQRFQLLQQKINELNNKHFISEKELNSIINTYHLLNGNKSQSILGNLQQDYNDYAYKVWINKLNNDFGQAIKNVAIKQAKNKVLEEIKINIQNANTKVNINKTTVPVYSSMDSQGSNYKINSMEKGININFQPGRRHILKNINQFYNQATAAIPDKLYGYISLEEALQNIENFEHFGTHWINLHSNMYNTHLDNQLKMSIAYDVFVKHHQINNNRYFVAIDSKNGTVKVKDLNDLVLNQIYQVNIKPVLHSFHFNNDFIGKHNSYAEAMVRIGNILREIRTINLQASLRI